MRKEISFTIPLEEGVLRSMATMLLGLAGQVAVGPVEEFLEDTPEAMGDRIDKVVAAAEAGNTLVDAELDIEGRPWDKRIDSSAKSKTADGRWKIRHGKDFDAALVESVKAEYAVAVGSAVVAAPAVLADPVAPVPVPPAPAPAPAPPAPVAPVVVTGSYEDLQKLIMGQISGAGIQPADISKACEVAGTETRMLPGLAEATPEVIGAVYVELERVWAARAAETA